TMKSNHQVLTIGPGLVGSSTAYHLAELGISDDRVVEQGRQFATGGSGSHAPVRLLQTTASQLRRRLAAHTDQLLSGLEHEGRPCYYRVGGIEVATTQQRWDELKRKHGLAASWGIDGELITPEQVHELFPQVEPSRIHGGWYVPSDGIAKPVRAAAAMAARARQRGVRDLERTEGTGLDLRGGRD